MGRPRTLLLLLALSLASPASAQTPEDPRVAWLAEHAVRLRSIAPEDDDFADLEPLVPILGDARIVMLGEQSHGDGASFLAKTRLIAFLHQKMGFDVLAFESGLYDCRKAWERYRAGDDPLAAGRQGIFGIWTQSFEVRPLLEYLGRSATTARPLTLCGFDCQLTAAGSRESLVPELRAVIGAVDPKLPDTDAWRTARDVVRGLMDHEHRYSAEEREAGRAALASLRETLGAPNAARVHSPRELAFWRQMLASLMEQLEVHYARQQGPPRSAADNNRRDAQMARNLIWLADTYYPDRKIVVWAATFHIMRNAPSLERVSGGGTYEGTVPMGHLVWKHFGDRCYALGLTAYEGRHGRPWTESFPLPRPEKGTFEDLCARAGLENALVDFRGAGKDGAWLERPLVARPLGYAPMRGDWTEVLDGMLFTRRMTPSTRTGAPRGSEGAEPVPDELTEVVRRRWKTIRAGRASGNPWVDKWDFSSVYRSWKAKKRPDAEALALQEKAVAAWFADHEEEEGLAWRAHWLLADLSADRGDSDSALELLSKAVAAYPDHDYPEPAKQSKLQHLVNARAMLLWDLQGREAAVSYAVGLLAADRRFHYFYLPPWTARLSAEGDSARAELVGKVRDAYAARAKRFPDLAEEAKRFADALP